MIDRLNGSWLLLGAPGHEPRASAPVADERTHRHLARAQRMHDMRPHEPGSARDED